MVTVSFSDTPPPGLQEIRARIPDDGMLTLHHSVRIKAAGLSVPELERQIRAAFVPKMYRNLTAIVRAEDRDYFVGGEVKAPNRYPLRGGDMTVLRAIDSAGGFTEFANRNKIDLRRQDGTKVRLSEKKIIRGEMVDLPVLANDHIKVNKRLW
jgi:protein involved in polysaccharide export with SLBB domain